MLTPEELSGFLAGQLGEVLELSYVGLKQVVLFERSRAGVVVAHIPRESGRDVGMFSFDAALNDPMCGATYSLTDTEYVVDIKTRSQARSVTKMALVHLGWTDEARLQSRLIKKASAK